VKLGITLVRFIASYGIILAWKLRFEHYFEHCVTNYLYKSSSFTATTHTGVGKKRTTARNKWNVKKTEGMLPLTVLLPRVSTCHFKSYGRNGRCLHYLHVSCSCLRDVQCLGCVTDRRTSQITVIPCRLLEKCVQLSEKLRVCKTISNTDQLAILCFRR